LLDLGADLNAAKHRAEDRPEHSLLNCIDLLESHLLEYGPDKNLGHAAQKPVALFRDLLSRSARPGDTVLDPFCGTGSILEAAHDLKVKATGIENDPTSYGIAARRLEMLKVQLELGI